MAVSSAISAGLIALIIPAVLAWCVSKTRSTNAIMKDGKYALQYGTGFRLIGWVAIAIPFLVGIPAIIAILLGMKLPVEDPENIPYLIAFLFLLFVPLGMSLIYARTVFDSNNIQLISAWRRSRQISWNAITEYSYSVTSRAHIFKTNDSRKIGISIVFDGLDNLYEEAKKHNIKNLSDYETWKASNRLDYNPPK